MHAYIYLDLYKSKFAVRNNCSDVVALYVLLRSDGINI